MFIQSENANYPIATHKDYALKIFKYLKALNDENFPQNYDITKELEFIWFDNLPCHDNLKLVNNISSIHKSVNNSDSQTVIFEISRPQIKPAPKPGDLIKEFILNDFLNPEIDNLKINNHIVTEKDGIEFCHILKFDPLLESKVNDYIKLRNEWLAEHKLSIQAYKVFEKFYSIFSLIQKEGEKYELLVGNAILAWKFNGNTLNYPLLLNGVTLQFDAKKPAFKLVLNDNEIAVNEFTLTSFTDISHALSINPKLFENLSNDIKEVNDIFDPDIDSLRSFIQTLHIDGNVLDSIPDKFSATCNIYLRPVFFIRNRLSKLSQTYSQIINSYSSANVTIPDSIKKITGFHDNDSRDLEQAQFNFNFLNCEEQLKDIYLTKPYNIEQIQILKHLQNNKAILVQGPPGTGKTHTIANLLGHFLSAGKNVLVISQTSKALQVIRDKVPANLKSLCVSILDNDINSTNILNESITKIIEIIGEYSTKLDILNNEIIILDTTRNNIINQISQLKDTIYNIRLSEYSNLNSLDSTISIKDAAIYLNENQESLGYINGEINLEITSKFAISNFFSNEEFKQLIELQNSFDIHKCEILDNKETLIKALILPNDFNLILNNLTVLQESVNEEESIIVNSYANASDIESRQKLISNIIGQINLMLAILNDKKNELYYLIIQNFNKNAITASIDEFINNLENNINNNHNLHSKFIQFNPKLSDNFKVNKENLAIIDEMIDFINTNKKINTFNLLLKPRWNNVYKQLFIDDSKPQSLEDFILIKEYANSLYQQDYFNQWYQRLLQAYNIKSNINQPEDQIEFCKVIKNYIGWYKNLYLKIVSDINSLGLNFNFEQISISAQSEQSINNIIEHFNFLVLPQLNSILTQIKIDKDRFCLAQLKEKLISSFDNSDNFYLQKILTAIDEYNYDSYSMCFNEINKIFQLNDEYIKRNQLLTNLSKIAPDFADTIRQHNFDSSNKNLNFELAFDYALLNKRFNSRLSQDINQMQFQLKDLQNSLLDITKRVVELKTYYFITKNITPKQRQSLIGWHDITRKIGKGYGKRVGALKREAYKLLSETKNIVPVWIMPFSRLSDTFDVCNTKFDILIVDEASQSDLNSLLALTMAQECIIVGDHEQISPSAIGQETDSINNLIDAYLDNIPNKVIYDGKTSLYDIAKQSFPVSIMLKEHFRCLPEIIDYSNQLCYQGKIKPLKDSSTVNIKPPLVGVKVNARPEDLTDSNVNKAEALTITSIIIAALEFEQYSDKTFGVISLLGSEQANYIDKLLRFHLDPIKYTDNKILCGNSSIFQGDERDVILLSMVDIASDENVLRLKEQASFKQRYNVAASRASEQLFVIHSLDPNLHLKKGDLRAGLLNHVYSNAYSNNFVQPEKLQKAIYSKLLADAYRVKTNYKVGYYQIDLLVELDGSMLAIVIDGDCDFIQEKFMLNLENQFILERLGWRFLNLSAGDFYFDFDRAYAKLIDSIANFKILNKSCDITKIIQANLIDDILLKAKVILKEKFNIDNDLF